MDADEPVPVVPNEVPAAYINLVDSRSQNQSQLAHPSSTLTVDNDPDYSVSRNHCEVYVITYEPTINYVYVRDRKSSNGTYVNGELIGIGPEISPGYLLQDGDIIEIRPYWTFAVIQERQPPRHDLDTLQLEESKLFEGKYTFTELASGGDLMSFIYRQDMVKEFDCRIIIRQVVRGLGYLHDKGIVHRDLKPENILLAYSPKIAYHRVMLADFGNSAVPHRSRMVTKVGTMNYQAPEFLASTQVHTSAVDIWSLGIVVLVLLASSCDPEIEDINRMNQTEIEEYLKGTFAKMNKQPSRDGKTFVWDCLQTMPWRRMNAIGAECHNWLCTPEKYLRFFQLLDNKMMSDWKPHDELKPMPLELPNLRNSPKVAEMNLELRCSQYFATDAMPQSSSGPLKTLDNCTGHDKATQSDHAISEEVVSSGVLVLRPKSPANTTAPGSLPHEDATQKLQQGGAKQQQENAVKQPRLPWKGFLKPTHPAQAGSRARVRKGSRIRPRDALLPLPGLDRHLRPFHNRHHRQQVLEELEKSNAKFLTDPDGIMPSTPPNLVRRLQTPEAPRAEKRMLHGVGKLNAQAQLSTPRINLR
ncbi:hypothetical protein G7Z17_g10078 [Cylindrodendrum hubeiense]|uniref:Uncharacterized protein n=1 Tax=Cylindrodendrum hubeiense TaxID=595255 RepID=A0A9P5H5J0_9HYPO|nr:hypothetical protein G7Z17_g10078 [Cylindrodendrum hubeiense]